MNKREALKNKKRIVVKVGSSTITHKHSGRLNLKKLDILARVLSDLKNQGKEVILVTSGAIAVGRAMMGIAEKPKRLAQKQACAAIGQGILMMTYQKLFAEYGYTTAQVLMTKNTVVDPSSRKNASNTLTELLSMGAIPIVNENDTVETLEIKLGDNDSLSSIVTSLVNADLLILLSDIEGLYTDDPNTNPEAQFIPQVNKLTSEHLEMAKGTTGSGVGTGGMATKMIAAQISTYSGADMVICNGQDICTIQQIMDGEERGTLFASNKKKDFNLAEFVEKNI